MKAKKEKKKEKNRELKKLTGRDIVLISSELTKHLERKRKKKKEEKKKTNPRFRCNKVSGSIVLVLLLQHPVLVLVFEK
jgi:hypothetical protein